MFRICLLNKPIRTWNALTNATHVLRQIFCFYLEPGSSPENSERKRDGKQEKREKERDGGRERE